MRPCGSANIRAGDQQCAALVAAQVEKIVAHQRMMEKQIEQMPQLLQSELDQQRANAGGMPQEEFKRFSNIARSAFDAKAIHASVQAYLQSNLSEKDMKDVLEWLESPLGAKITKL